MEQEISRLRRLNIGAGILHTVSFIAILLLSNNFSLPVQATYLTDAPGRGKFTDASDLATALQNGETMGYEHLSSGGMGEVQTNLSKLPESDIQALAEYITSLK